MRKPSNSTLRNQVRIIAGIWRGRKLPFPDLKNLRPTPDRVRETLFNWLAKVINGANCLDLFAGSGALGFEALSRGAANVVFVDSAPEVIANLHANQKMLQAENLEIYHMNAEQYLSQTKEQFDIVFLDPPFQKQMIPTYCQLLAKNNLLKANGYAYIETNTTLLSDDLPQNWQIIKQKRAGKVRYYLLTILS
ncbi:MAG: 16S rRNA (guanine(966)-N(2))-methyltransferase RsmD [Gammaproteobacteria bacterium]|jgi:16S rRNA (guanine966-N2)-methyltransferase